MVKASIKVCIRTRPTQDFAQDKLFIDTDHNTIQVQSAGENDGGLLNNKQSNFKFRFDQVFHNASQSQVYDLKARSTVLSVIEGINSAILTYGQTGSGKTFTMVCENINVYQNNTFNISFITAYQNKTFNKIENLIHIFTYIYLAW